MKAHQSIIITVIIVALLVVCLVACGENAVTDQKGSSESEVTSALGVASITGAVSDVKIDPETQTLACTVDENTETFLLSQLHATEGLDAQYELYKDDSLTLSLGADAALKAGDNTFYVKVTVDGQVQTYTVKVHRHVFGEWNVITPASCVAQGQRVRSCRYCDAQEHEAVSKGAHDWGAWNVTTPATCQTSGERTHECKVCHAVDTETIAKGAHQWGEWILQQEQSCLSSGIKIRYCSLCNRSDVDTSPALGHVFAKEGDCTEGITCTRCQETVVLPHSFSSAEVIKKNSCVDYGLSIKTCARCAYHGESYDDPTGHNFRIVSNTKSTCTQKGVVVYGCADCSVTYTETYSMIDHSTARGVCSTCYQQITTWDDELRAVDTWYTTEVGNTEARCEARIEVNNGTIERVKQDYGISYLYSESYYVTQIAYQQQEVSSLIAQGASQSQINSAQRELTKLNTLRGAAQLVEENSNLADQLQDSIQSFRYERDDKKAEINRKYQSYVPNTTAKLLSSTYQGFDCRAKADGTYAVVGYVGTLPATLAIPAQYKGTRVTSIDAEAFAGNTSLVSVYIATGVTVVGADAFRDCTALNLVVFGNADLSIGDGAFVGTAYVEADVVGHRFVDVAYLEATCTHDGHTAYQQCSRCDYHTEYTVLDMLPHDLEDVPYLAPTCTEQGHEAYQRCTNCDYTTEFAYLPIQHDYVDYICVKCGTEYCTLGLEFADVEEDTCRVSAYKGTDTDVHVPAVYEGKTVVTIASNAFARNKSIVSLYLPDSLTTIPKGSLSGCIGLQSISLPFAGLTIEATEGSFGAIFGDTKYDGGVYCAGVYGNGYYAPESLTTVVVRGDPTKKAFYFNKTVTDVTVMNCAGIGEDAFYICSKLAHVTLINVNGAIDRDAFSACKALETVDLGEGITSIGSFAFSGCEALTSIKIGASVTSINGWVFSGCSALTTIEYAGTMAQWKTMNKSYNWDSGLSNYVVICSDGTVSKS